MSDNLITLIQQAAKYQRTIDWLHGQALLEDASKPALPARVVAVETRVQPRWNFEGVASIDYEFVGHAGDCDVYRITSWPEDDEYRVATAVDPYQHWYGDPDTIHTHVEAEPRWDPPSSTCREDRFVGHDGKYDKWYCGSLQDTFWTGENGLITTTRPNNT